MAHEEDVEHMSVYRCQGICNKALPCGHTCVSMCHPEDVNHKNAFRCPIPCDGTLDCGHECNKKFMKNHSCSDHAIHCSVECGASLPCGHICHQPCHMVDHDHLNEFCCIKCTESQENVPSKSVPDSPESKKYPPDSCIHGRMKSVGGCKDKCGFQYPCGHSCDKRCLHAADKNHEKACDRMCNTFLSCGHKCTSLCHFRWFPHDPGNVSNWVCTTCEKALHRRGTHKPEADEQNSEISFDQNTNKECEFTFNCGHMCARSRGTHIHNNSDASSTICKRECGATLVCGHSCKLRCHYKSASPHELPATCRECKKDVDTSWRAGSWMQARKIELHRLPPKNATNEVCAHGTPMVFDCDHGCGFKYKCGHICRENCRHNAGELHPNTCIEMCGAFLDCGHSCKLQCHYSTALHNALDRCYKCMRGKINSGSDLSRMAEHHEINYEYTGSVLLEVCSHGNMLKFGCRKRCGVLFKCGHACRDRCFHQRDPKHLRACLSTCGAFLSCGHICKVPCHFKVLRHKPSDRCMGCTESKPKDQIHLSSNSSNPGCNLPCKYKCGHNCAEKCQYLPVSNCEQSGQQPRLQTFPKPFGHPISSGPHEDFAQCKDCSALNTSQNLNLDEPLIYCMHQKSMLSCNDKCPGKLACGHKCSAKLRRTSHPCSIHLVTAANMCQKKCKNTMPCGHHCSGKCHMGSELHVCKKCDCSSFFLLSKPKGHFEKKGNNRDEDDGVLLVNGAAECEKELICCSGTSREQLGLGTAVSAES